MVSGTGIAATHIGGLFGMYAEQDSLPSLGHFDNSGPVRHSAP